MLRHEDVWRAIDLLAAEHGLTPSGLARKAGLDPTTFNKSKRITREGKPRWPSTESVAKILEATGSTLDQFTAYVTGSGPGRKVHRIPLLRLAEAGIEGYFDDSGRPAGKGWDEIVFPNLTDPHAYALEVAGKGLEPVYRDGDALIVSPAAGIRRGDRVVLRTTAGELLVGQLLRQTAHRIDLMSLGAGREERSLALADVLWMARILWVSQ